MEGSEVHSRRSSARSGRSTASSSRKSSAFAKPFGFNNKTNFAALENLVLTRSDSYILRKPPPDDNVWKRPAPDFRPQVWAPSPPKRNTQDSMKPCKYGTYPGDYLKRPRKPRAQVLPHLLLPERAASPQIVTRFRIPDPYEAKLLYVKHGVYPKGQYKMPKPHDFRGYPPLSALGLDEFDVFYDHDPYDLKFKSERINMQSIEEVKLYIADPIPCDPKRIDRQRTNRHRRLGRTPHSALMERIEDRLSRKWEQERSANERIQKEIDEQNQKLKEQEQFACDVEAAMVV
ncbi:uncharacterized protein LOC100374336 [Saccoglossus kowalevskii]|uniref:Uncharacterized protein LOC100374336 n=1 Tax=Saccoglossus kowalevskii TaxID=10224 RepID=A0ABM0MQ34_SACKO|nr:PREDICTED: uncharacterized protein LOC100374336 [Saccoglossus kowalevskii]